MKSRLLAESPEDLYGPLKTCTECEDEYHTGYSTRCPSCGFDPREEYDPDPDLYAEEYPAGYDGTGSW